MSRGSLFKAALGIGALWAAFCVLAGAGAPAPNRIRDALEILVRVPSGRDLVQKAQDSWKMKDPFDLLGVLQWGGSSRTDAVLTRHFNPQTGQEQRERQVTVYLREGQSLEDLVLDIAHELVHATARPAWDPYDPALTPGRYIQASIDGPGGEVEAVMAECRVGLELTSRFGASMDRCRSYVTQSATDGAQVIDRSRVRTDFYRVGKWDHDLSALLGSERTLFPLMTNQTPKLFSSTGHAPYPVALYREFEEITAIACENTRRRQSSASLARSPASIGDFLAKRCGK